MTLTKEQVDLLRDSYAWMIVDDLTVYSLREYCAAQLADELGHVEEEQLIERIAEMYDEETANDLVTKVINHTK